MRLRIVLPALSLLLSSLPLVAMTPSADAATKPARPDPIIEISSTSGTGSQVRIVIPSVPSGVKQYQVRNRDTGAILKRCTPASMKNGSGSRGCYFNITSGYYSNKGVLVAVGTNNVLSDAVYVPATDLGGDDGTQQFLFINGSVRSVARLYQTATSVLKSQAAGCAGDAAVKTALSQLKKQTTRAALASKNPYVAAVAIVANGIAYYDKKAGFENRCAAIADLLKNIASAAARAKTTSSGQSFVFAESTWVRASGPDFCQIYVSGSVTKSRPPVAGGLSEGGCESFWSPLVS